MAISFVGSTSQEPTAVITTFTSAVPAGVQAGDLLIFLAAGNVATTPATPSGYSVWHTATTTALHLSIWWKIAGGSESAPSTTQVSNRGSSSLLAYRGVDNTTPEDVASASANGTTGLVPPSITPVTAGAWVLTLGAIIGASTVTTTNWSSTNLTAIDVQASSKVTTSTNIAHAVGRFAWSSGAFAANLTKDNTSTRSIVVSSVMRPSASSPVSIPRNIRTANPATVRSYTR